MSSVSSNRLLSSKGITISRITKLLPVNPMITSPPLTSISLKVLVGLLVLMLKRGEAERHRREGATVAIELRRQSGGVALMARGRCATLVVYVSIYLRNMGCCLLTVFRLRKTDSENGTQSLCLIGLFKFATKGVEPTVSLRWLVNKIPFSSEAPGSTFYQTFETFGNQNLLD